MTDPDPLDPRRWLAILARWRSLLPWVRRRYLAEPWPWTRCHCGALADIAVPGESPMCAPCTHAAHPTCECSDPEIWGALVDIHLTDREDRR